MFSLKLSHSHVSLESGFILNQIMKNINNQLKSSVVSSVHKLTACIQQHYNNKIMSSNKSFSIAKMKRFYFSRERFLQLNCEGKCFDVSMRATLWSSGGRMNCLFC